MSSIDDADGAHSRSSSEAAGNQVDHMLFESLVYLLIEKGVLTKNDALSVVQTVAQVKRGALHEGQTADATTRNALIMLQRMYASFEALEDRPGTLQQDGENVHRMRPPVHDDRPEFPRDD